MNKIEGAINLIDNNFPTNWPELYSFDKSREEIPDLTTEIEKFKSMIDNVEEDFFDFLNLSILRGEYIEEQDFRILLKKLKNKIESLRPTITIPDEEVQEILYVSGFITGFIEPLKLALNLYSEFTLKVERKLGISDKEYIFQYHDEILNAIEEKKCDENSLNNLELLQTNIIVAECDHFLSVENNHLALLVKILRKLTTKLNIKPYVQLIILKASFLRNKLILRFKHERNPKQIYTLINGLEKQVTVEEMLNGRTFDEWLIYANFHYELKKDDWKTSIIEKYELIKNKKTDNLSIFDLHLLIKYHKDVNRNYPSSLELLKNISDVIQTKREKAIENNDIFNIYALSIALNYAVNNELSLLCEKENVKIEEVEKLYDYVIRIQSLTSIKNFFPQYRYLKFLLKQLNNLYKEKKALDVVASCSEIINKCKKLYDKYEENVNWSKRNYNYVYQLPLHECFIKINDANTDKIFVFSSFLLPLIKDRYLKEFEEYKNEVAQLETSVRVFENIEPEISALKQLKNEVEIVKNSANDREVKTMEMLGIFTALISFVAASLPTFKVIDTPLQAALFMLALATSFSVFVVLLLSFRDAKKLKENIKVIKVGSIITGGFWVLLILFSLIFPTNPLNQIKKDSSEDIKTIHDTITRDKIIYINKDTI